MINTEGIVAEVTSGGIVKGGVSNNGSITATANNGIREVITSDYEELNNRPKINGVELIGDKSLDDLGIKQEYNADDIHFEDGSTFQDKYNSGELKGDKGDTGAKGEQGIQGVKGDKGDKGDKGEQGIQGIQGIQGVAGKDGANGKDGVDGKTPVKGTDYYTEADKQEMVNLVLASLPSSEGVSY